MKENTLVFELILNIGLLVLVANLLSKFRLIQNLIVQEQRSFKSQTLLSVIFGGVIVLSTYTGIDIGSYSLNTRVIGASRRADRRALRIPDRRGLCVFLLISAGICHGVGLLHDVIRPSRRGILSVFSAGQMEIQGSVSSDLFCGSL